VCADLSRLDADIAVVGVPTDEGSPFMPGSRFAPRSIREHSLRFVADVPGVYDPQERRRFLGPEMAQSRIADVGDADILPTNVVGSFQNITQTVAGVLQQGAMPVILGGDHAITFPVVRGFGGTGPLYVVHFDAHLDYMPFVHGLEYTNAHAFRHIRQMDYVQGITQAGIRSLRGAAGHPDRARRAHRGHRVRPRGGQPDAGRGHRRHVVPGGPHGGRVPRVHLRPAGLEDPPGRGQVRRLSRRHGPHWCHARYWEPGAG
jgi:agmatinase